ncbi:MAG: Crp/Fnr family transcriptional regulator [Candidatus Omnitrophica bacterium]|nr:Crp/Fnr family transcriptional regulator [Candidatus Omnitrophota bacterium]
MDIADLLAQIDLFKGLSLENRRVLAEASLHRKISKNQILFTEGEKGAHIFVLAKGAVQLHKIARDGREVLIKSVKPGELFAEVILFEQNTYPVTAIAVQTTSVYLIPIMKIHELLEDKDFRNGLISVLLKKHRYLTNRILYLSAHDVEDRFKLYLKDQYGKKPGTFPSLSKRNVSSAIGTTPETLSRLLLKYKKQKTLVWDKNGICIQDAFWQ